MIPGARCFVERGLIGGLRPRLQEARITVFELPVIEQEALVDDVDQWAEQMLLGGTDRTHQVAS
ncbi:MAG: hypothetical protein NZ899_13780 [Thermoguttaceae bacterium]|nr:hypothetical protein [Thermoguttaceae bacterium]MDW8080012.1 hypothetical protein [Thermoguttaceae bacterium]